MGDNKGITLIELLAVIGIIGMLVFFISAGTTTPVDGSILESAANMIAQDIRLTQQLAITRGDRYFFEIHTRDNYYRIYSPSSQKAYKEELIHEGISISIIGFESLYTGPLYKDLKTLKYTQSGTPGTTGTIILRKGSMVKRITVMVGTGRVKVD